MDDSTQDATWWLEMVKIARKGFDVLSKSEMQATAWQPKNLAWVKKKYLHLVEVLIKLWWSYWCGGSNLYWTSWWKWLDTFGVIHIYWMESSHMLKMAMLEKKIKWTCWHPLLVKIENDGNVLKEVNSSGFKFFLI